MGEMMERYKTFLKEQDWFREGDCVYVSSDLLELSKLFRENGERLDPDGLIELLRDLTGEKGTLIFPTYNWDFCKGIAFDYRKTISRTGALSRAALKRDDFKRTRHPIYSWCVAGEGQEELVANRSADSFGPDSVFSYLKRVDAKCLSLGLPALSGQTYIHYVEQCVGVPYRYRKEFTADYTDAEGRTEKYTCSMYVRDLQMDPRHKNGFAPLAEKMSREGKISSADFGGVEHHLLRAADLERAVMEDITGNDSALMYDYHHIGR